MSQVVRPYLTITHSKKGPNFLYTAIAFKRQVQNQFNPYFQLALIMGLLNIKVSHDLSEIRNFR